MTAVTHPPHDSRAPHRSGGPTAPPLASGTGGGRDPIVSFEFFPPKTDKMEQTLWDSVQRLAPLNPAFVSVTYGAGGSTRERTHTTVARIQAEAGLNAAAHLTCVNATRDEIDAVARSYWEAGIRHIVALRGDVPGGAPYRPVPGGYGYADDLVAGLRRVADFEVSVAAYPEVHPTAPSAQFDLDHLKRKIDNGATRAITQFFFDNACFLRFRDKAAAVGITVPIVPGILPVTNFARMLDFARPCGAVVPGWMHDLFGDLDTDPDQRQLVAASVATEQCRSLMEEGVDQFHFYTLNRADLTLAICRMLGLRAEAHA